MDQDSDPSPCTRSCTDMERKLHSFVGEVACGRWAIGQTRRFLWGYHFYWMCDCSAVKEILEYDGNISYICRWAQELLGYHFSCIHRCNKMMGDVDSFTRRYGTSIAAYCAIASFLSRSDRNKRPKSYDRSLFTSLLKKKEAATPATLHVITDKCIATIQSNSTVESIPISDTLITTAPLLIVSKSLTPEKETPLRALDAPASLVREIVSIDDVFHTANDWSQSSNLSTCIWHNSKYFTSPETFKLSLQLDPSNQGTMITPKLLSSFFKSNTHSNITIIDWTIPCRWHCIQQRMHDIIHCTSVWTHSISSLRLILLWIPYNRYQSISSDTILSTFKFDLPQQWKLDATLCNSTDFGDTIELKRILITISLQESLFTNLAPTNSDPKGIFDAINSIDATDIHEDLQFPKSILTDQGDANLWRARPSAILTSHTENS